MLMPFLDFYLSIPNGMNSADLIDIRDVLYFEIVNFSFLVGFVPFSPSYGAYNSQLIQISMDCSNVSDLNNIQKYLNAKFLKETL